MAVTWLDSGDLLGDELGAEPDGLGPHPSHELGSHDPVGEPGEVLDLGGRHQRATEGCALEHDRGEVGPGGVDGGGESRRPRTDDDNRMVRGH